MDGVGIYFLIKANKVVYVGKTLVWPLRLKAHIGSLMDFENAKFLKYPANELSIWEKAYIKKYKPYYNIMHNKKQKREKKQLRTFHVGTAKWKKRVHKMKFRKLTEKSFIGFGRHRDRTVSYVLQIDKMDIISIYYTLSHITFFDNILDSLGVTKEWRIQKTRGR